jgi:hypothetical protein
VFEDRKTWREESGMDDGGRERRFSFQRKHQ